MAKVRTRFAPSPTGYMHIGNLRTALYEYLIAKHDDGDFILRIEDTDQEREVEGAVDMIYKVMDQTGLGYDEGPNKPGDVGPYVQSERLAIYKEYADKLVELGGAHYCFCDEETINAAKEESHNEEQGYIDPCKNISLEEAKKRIASGEKYVVRQTIPSTGVTSFEDEVYGHIEVENAGLAEGVLLKSDGYPTYNFANIVDDHLMNITHVVRGNEYLSSTPKYNLIYQAFGWDVPTYIHLPPVMKDDKHKLSKRNGDASYQDLINKGFLNEAILNYIALLGWSPKEEKEIFTLDELVEQFDIKRISKAPALFDINKLKWMNGIYIRNLSLEQFHQLALSHYQKITRAVDLLALSKLLQQRVSYLDEIEGMIDFIQDPLPFNACMFINKKMKTNEEQSLEALLWLQELLKHCKDTSIDNLYQQFVALAKEKHVKNGQIMYPLRVALSFKEVTPGGAVELVSILGLQESLRRIEQAILGLKNKKA